MIRHRFRAMGTDVEVLVVGGLPTHASRAEQRLRDLDNRWSRFLPDSELSRLNRSSGATVEVSVETALLLKLMRAGHEMTGGLFDPSVHDAVVAAGYHRSFDQLLPSLAGRAPVATSPVRGLRELRIDGRTARLARGVRLDPGAIGKGLAADLVVEELLSDGVEGICVNVGGDLRVAGRPPDPAGWGIEVERTPAGEEVLVGLLDGAVATSTVRLRRWSVAGEERHHVIDPRTARPASSDVTDATVLAANAWTAEVLATAAIVGGRERAGEVLRAVGGRALLTGPDGEMSEVGEIAEYVW